MAKKLRKMLGDVNAPSTIALMRLIDTQSRATICAWCLDYAQAQLLPIFQKYCAGDDRPEQALNAARDYLAGKVGFAAVKDTILKQCHAAARELEDNPAAQAAARACGQAAAVVHTLTHSLGIYFYGAAAIAYDRAGCTQSSDTYAAIAEEVCADITQALQRVAVPDEPHPVKLTWHC